QKAGFYLRVLEDLRSLPGVKDAGLISPAPYGELMYSSTFVPEDSREAGQEGRIGTSNRLVAPGSLQALGAPLVSGRMFTRHDHEEAPNVVIVSDTLARSVWPGQNPVGKRITLGAPGKDPWLTVIGVVGDVRYNSAADAPGNELYRPYAQHPRVSFATGVIVRTTVEPESAATMVRESVHRIDPEAPISDLRTVNEAVDAGLTGRRFFLGLIIAFAATALALAAAGVYGAVSYTVSQSTREIGIRMAVGSSASNILRLYLTKTLRWIAGGLLAGGLLAVWMVRLLSSQLYGVSGVEPAVALAAAVVLIATAALAAYLPARRAAGLDPNRALRHE
ncbi:MAG: FtsX-like permease family protein, partial [bacterium]|nr:FtsX-like permease family protein [bacterium]